MFQIMNPNEFSEVSHTIECKILMGKVCQIVYSTSLTASLIMKHERAARCASKSLKQSVV